MSDASILNVICRRTDLDHILEGQFIRGELFSALGRPLRLITVETEQPWPILDNSLLLVLGRGEAYTSFFEAFRSAGHRNLGILHMADEKGLVDCGFYAQARYVLRNYFFPDRIDPEGIRGQPCVWVPNGYANGVGPIQPDAVPPFHARQHLLFFAGNVTGAEGDFPDRASLFETVKAHGLPSIMAATQGFGSGMGRVSYAAFLANSKFAPVPAGMSPETIRLYDALENGAVPVAIDAPFIRAEEALGNPPFPVLSDWQALPELLAPVIANDEAATARWTDIQTSTVQWWRDFKHAKALEVSAVIARAFVTNAS